MKTSFNADWIVRPNVSIFTQLNADADESEAITLPHDAMLDLPRAPEHGPSTGYFAGGSVAYTKRFDVPGEWRDKRVSVEFQGVYRDATVFVNGAYLGQRPYGYSPFRIALDPALRYGETNEIRVEARAHSDSRWYSGLGIYRDTVLTVSDLLHLTADGIRIATPDVDAERAVVEVSATLTNEGVNTRTVRVAIDIVDGDGRIVAVGSSPATLTPGETATARQRLYVPAPRLWDLDSPHQYSAQVRVTEGEETVDEDAVRFGVRTLRLDPAHGLRLNGVPIKLRGACVHHDNGVLGAASIYRAEERRIEILKAAGFNAIRAAHTPLSHAALDACDRLGMLVVDEAFDMWTKGKNPFDYSLAFPEWWERDIEAMVAKDINRPSVIMYSIGNEVLDAGNALGARWGRRLAEKVRTLDPTRFITNGISGFVATISDILPMFQAQVGELSKQVGVNDLMSQLGDLMDRISLSDVVTDKTEESHSVVDVVGHNYAHERYLGDVERFPDRVLMGTETLAKKIDEIWPLVVGNPHVIGDFTWTGWDYLGEAGLGLVAYADADADAAEPQAFPTLLSWAGDIDITGHRRPASFYREIVFGLRTAPYIAVHRPTPEGSKPAAHGWAWTDSIGSWTWGGTADVPLTVDVYSPSTEVELVLNGRSLGRRPTRRHMATFEVPYEPGTIEAVALDGATEIGRYAIASAGEVKAIRVGADQPEIRADDSDLSYLTIELVDADGVVSTLDDRPVTVTVGGAGRLQGLGSARPVTDETYTADTHTTFEGRALAVIRPTGAGPIRITTAVEGLDPVTVTVTAG